MRLPHGFTAPILSKRETTESYLIYHLALRSKKAGRFEKLIGFARSHSIVTHDSVSLLCAITPPRSYFSKS